MARRRRSKGVSSRLVALNRLLKQKRPRSALETQCIERAIGDLDGERQNGLVWREDEAARVVNFCTLLRHWQGPSAGRSFTLEPWQEHLIVAPLFGWYRESDNRRRFTESYVEVPRKNGKSFLAAAIALQGLLADGERGPEVYAVATKFEQALIVFKDAVNSMRGNVALDKMVTVLKQSVLCGNNDGVLKPVCGNPDTIHGLKASRVIVDELHSHKTRDVYDVVVSSRGSRRQPLVFGITTAGTDRSSICWELHQRSVNILEGHHDVESFHCFIAGADADDDFSDPRTWSKANPNLGISVFSDYLEEEAQKAKDSPSAENTFRRLHLNQWTEQAVRVIPMNIWDECVGDVNAAELIGRPCYAALDIASTRDVTSLVLAFPCDGGRFKLIPYFWVPEEAADDRGIRDRRQVMAWANRGFITKTDGCTADITGKILEDVAAILERHEVKDLALDPWHDAGFSQLLVKNFGFPQYKLTEFRQSMANFAGPMNQFLRLILDRKLEHGGNPVLRWMAGNLAAREDESGNRRPDKKNSADKIDGIVASIMAIGRAMTCEEAARPTFYEEHELEVG